MSLRTRLTILLLVVLVSQVWGRGGGGCFEAGTPIRTPAGDVPIEQLNPGDVVLAVQDGRLRKAKVQTRFEVRPAEYLELTVGGRRLRVTAEHPFAVGPGEFREASCLRAGDELLRWDGGELRKMALESVRQVKARRPAHNLLISPLGTFLADGVWVHNKGCFLPDTPILRADGSSVPISQVRPGDELLAFGADGVLGRARVLEVFTHDVAEYFVVSIGDVTLRVTPEHPFYVGKGSFKTLEALRVGDRVFVCDGRGLRQQTILSMEKVRARVRVWNLQTDRPHTFFANGIAVHNKGGGCFPSGTGIETARGRIGVEKLVAGDQVLGVDDRDRIVPTRVKGIRMTRSAVLVLETDLGNLRTTMEHPVRMIGGGFRAAGELESGDAVLVRRRHQFQSAAVRARWIESGESDVFNLEVDAPHTFIADGFVVHNKGGGGGRSHSSGLSHSGGHSPSGNGGGSVKLLFIFVGVVVVILVLASLAKNRQDEDLDFTFSVAAIAPKRDKTLKLLEFISRVDSMLAPQTLEAVATTTFVTLQQCWQTRRYEPMKALLMPNLYADHCGQIAGLIRNHEINLIDSLVLKRIDLVNVRYTHKPNYREFTALITASARDYYVDERTRSFLRGDSAPADFQEFWTFQLLDGKWLLREIEQSRESDALKDENFFEPFTDQAVEQVYGEAAGKEGPAGPWLEKQTETKANRIERLLNFLVTTDRMWNRQGMTERARQVFIRVFSAWETGDPGAIPAADLFPDYAAQLAEGIRQQQAESITVEYRNLCVRKVELVLIRNFTDNSQDEFTVRISAHAQYIARRNGAIVHQDEYVSPFLEYWTFGRRDGQWKVKEVLAPADGESAVAEENVDQESSAEQLQWYYGKTRAI